MSEDELSIDVEQEIEDALLPDVRERWPDAVARLSSEVLADYARELRELREWQQPDF
jgi:hypothetical protein